MRLRSIISTCIVFATLQLSSCAYMQTHKNIEEAARTHTGYELTSSIELYRAGEQYYLATTYQQLRKHYPVIYDSIFLNGSNHPTWEAVDNQQAKVYHPISSGTATILQRNDGYASLQVLSDEIKNSNSPASTTLPSGAQRCGVKAEIAGNSVIWPTNDTPSDTPWGVRILSAVDQVCIDWPGTIAYNVAIPIMAPFVFFHEFLNED